MKKANVRTAISIMQRAAMRDCISMVAYQRGRSRGDIDAHEVIATTEEQLHRRGNTACFAGYVAVSREWAAAGNTISEDGEPVLAGDKAGATSSSEAIAEWLGISHDLARGLVFGSRTWRQNHVMFYDVPFSEVKAEDVIAKLEMILSGELV